MTSADDIFFLNISTIRVYFTGCWEECKWICNIAFDDVFSAFDLLRNVKCLLSHYSLLMKAVSGGFFSSFFPDKVIIEMFVFKSLLRNYKVVSRALTR